MSLTVVTLITFLYVGLLFATAYYADLRRSQNRSIISNPHVYSLSLAVYLSSWTFSAVSGGPQPMASISCRSISGQP